MGFREFISRGSGPKPPQEKYSRLAFWCTSNKVHGPIPKPELRRGQELIERTCTPCYNQHVSERKTV